jgi:hypothetical protein
VKVMRQKTLLVASARVAFTLHWGLCADVTDDTIGNSGTNNNSNNVR